MAILIRVQSMAQNAGHSPEDKKKRLEAEEMHFLRSVAGYRLIDHRCNEDIREELQVISKSKVIGVMKT
jgi:hypothetical protein